MRGSITATSAESEVSFDVPSLRNCNRHRTSRQLEKDVSSDDRIYNRKADPMILYKNGKIYAKEHHGFRNPCFINFARSKRVKGTAASTTSRANNREKVKW